MKNAKLTYSMILLAGALWCGAIVLAPVLAASSGTAGEAGRLLYAFFSPICHQLEGRSFTICGNSFGVCARCSAIYFGFFMGTLIFPFVRNVGKAALPRRRFLLIACVPVIIDAFPWRFGVYEATLTTRAVSGGIVGIVLAFFIIPAAVQAVAELTAVSSLTFHQQKGISDATETR